MARRVVEKVDRPVVHEPGTVQHFVPSPDSLRRCRSVKSMLCRMGCALSAAMDSLEI